MNGGGGYINHIEEFVPGPPHILWGTAQGELIEGESDGERVIANACAYGCDPKKLADNNRIYVSRNDVCPLEHHIYSPQTDSAYRLRTRGNRPQEGYLADGIFRYVAEQLKG